ATLGLARAFSKSDRVITEISLIQKELVGVMGELATHEDDLERYRETQEGASEALVERLSQLVNRLETQDEVSFARWATPGEAGSPAGAALDMGRTIVRRAERHVVDLVGQGLVTNPAMLAYLNRLSDVFWLLARLEEEPRTPTSS
ncbi:MAG: ATP:cob(I)alamin adenosyltransferase, partial [Verrucomicrobiota bacterium]